MKTATLKQGKKVLSLLEDVPEEQLQNLLQSGLLTDLLKANVEQVNRREFQKVCGLRSAISPTFRLIPTLDRDMRKEGWILEKDSKDKKGDFTPELVDIFKEGERSISGEELMERANKQGVCCGQRHAEAMFRSWEFILKEWQKNNLVFPETLWMDYSDRRRVPMLRWNGIVWDIVLGELNLACFDRSWWLVRPRK